MSHDTRESDADPVSGVRGERNCDMREHTPMMRSRNTEGYARWSAHAMNDVIYACLFFSFISTAP